MATKTPTLNEKLAAAQLEEQELRRRLHVAETARDQAVTEGRYADAERLKTEANDIREPLLIAEAHVQALRAGVDAMNAHLEAERQAQAEREAREQASAEHDAAIEAERVEVEVAQRLWAEVEPAWGALVQVLQAVRAADARLYSTQVAKHSSGVRSGRLHPQHPAPSSQHLYSSRIEANEALAFVLRHPQPFGPR